VISKTALLFMFSLGQLSVCVCVCEGDEGVHMSEARCWGSAYVRGALLFPFAFDSREGRSGKKCVRVARWSMGACR